MFPGIQAKESTQILCCSVCYRGIMPPRKSAQGMFNVSPFLWWVTHTQLPSLSSGRLSLKWDTWNNHQTREGKLLFPILLGANLRPSLTTAYPLSAPQSIIPCPLPLRVNITLPYFPPLRLISEVIFSLFLIPNHPHGRKESGVVLSGVLHSIMIVYFCDWIPNKGKPDHRLPA